MLKWGRPPAKKNWIRGKVGSGYYLNDTCKWQLDEALTEYFTGRKSVWGLSTDPAKLAKDTVDKDHKLPAQPERPHKRREDDEE
jgi:hypothetical protein